MILIIGDLILVTRKHTGDFPDACLGQATRNATVQYFNVRHKHELTRGGIMEVSELLSFGMAVCDRSDTPYIFRDKMLSMVKFD